MGLQRYTRRHCTRRTFLRGTAALGLAQFLSGCNGDRSSLSIWPLSDTVPSAIATQFRRQLERSTPLQFSPQENLADLFEQLAAWQQPPSKGDDGSFLPFLSQKPPSVADLAMLGDFWLPEAVDRQLLQAIDADLLSPLSNDPIDWNKLLRRDDRLWGAPYRWGPLVIAYRTDKFATLGWTPSDWGDLWKPELRRRISFPDSARVTIGTALKRLGASYNSENLDAVPELEDTLRQLQSQVKLYSSDAYLPPLLLGDTWAAVGWSADVLSLPQYGKTIGAIVPRSGTALWADLWVRPAQAETESELWRKWVQFCWQPEIAARLSVLTGGASPVLAGVEGDDRPAGLQNRPVLYPDRQVLRRSEFLLPLSDTAIAQYLELWVAMRSDRIAS